MKGVRGVWGELKSATRGLAAGGIGRYQGVHFGGWKGACASGIRAALVGAWRAFGASGGVAVVW